MPVAAVEEAGVGMVYDARLMVPPQHALLRIHAKVEQWDKSWQALPTVVGAPVPSATAPGASIPARQARPRASLLAPVDQVLALCGDLGAGKTWLLRYLADPSSGMPPLAVYLDLNRRAEFASSDRYLQSVEGLIQQQCGKGRAILLLDAVPSVLDERLRALEDRVLRPHLAQRESLVIMALVHPSRLCWRAPALQGGESLWLRPFNPPQTRTQVKRLDGAGLVRYRFEPTRLQDYGGGLPLLNRLLVWWERRKAFEILLDIALSHVPEVDRERVRRYLEAVCVVEVLEPAVIKRVIGAYQRARPFATIVPSSAGDVRNLLLRHGFVRSVPGTPGRLAVPESVRRATKEVLKAQNAELYATLNEAAQASGRGQ